jgi:hypothetical protein
LETKGMPHCEQKGGISGETPWRQALQKRLTESTGHVPRSGTGPLDRTPQTGHLGGKTMAKNAPQRLVREVGPLFGTIHSLRLEQRLEVRGKRHQVRTFCRRQTATTALETVFGKTTGRIKIPIQRAGPWPKPRGHNFLSMRLRNHEYRILCCSQGVSCNNMK